MDFDSMDERSVSTAHVRVAVRDINVSDDYCNLRLKYHIGSVLPSPLSLLYSFFLLFPLPLPLSLSSHYSALMHLIYSISKTFNCPTSTSLPLPLPLPILSSSTLSISNTELSASIK